MEVWIVPKKMTVKIIKNHLKNELTQRYKQEYQRFDSDRMTQTPRWELSRTTADQSQRSDFVGDK